MRFLLTNFLVAVVGTAAWQAGLLDWAAHLPRHVWLVIGFMGFILGGGLAFAIAGRWNIVRHIGQSLPQVGLLGTGIAIQHSVDGITQMSPETAFVMFHGIIAATPPTFAGLAGLLILHECEFWCKAP